MNIGVPRERRTMEYRVGLTPAGVELLANEGHTCYVERKAGQGAGFSDYDYERAAARIGVHVRHDHHMALNVDDLHVYTSIAPGRPQPSGGSGVQSCTRSTDPREDSPPPRKGFPMIRKTLALWTALFAMLAPATIATARAAEAAESSDRRRPARPCRVLR